MNFDKLINKLLGEMAVQANDVYLRNVQTYLTKLLQINKQCAINLDLQHSLESSDDPNDSNDPNAIWLQSLKIPTECYKPMKTFVLKFSPVAFKQLYSFHEYAVIFYTLDQYPASTTAAQQVAQHVRKQLNMLFEWCKLFILGTIFSHSHDWREYPDEWFNIHNITHVVNTGSVAEFLHDTQQAIDRLRNAGTLNDKITAISLALNTWHDSGSLFCADDNILTQDDNLSDHPELLHSMTPSAPFTIAQLDTLSNIPQRVIDNKIHKLIKNVDILDY